MGKLRVNAFAISADGFAAGPEQSFDNPLGIGGPGLHDWFYPTRTFRRMVAGAADGEGTTGVDNDFAEASFADVGAWIMGRGMFGPQKGPWPDDGWKGWWGPNPPYHVPVFVLTHYPRPPLEMEGGTVFHFVADGVEAALTRARAVAGAKDVRIGGGAATVRQYLEARLIDTLHVVVSPVLLGSGSALFGGLDLKALGYTVVRHTSSPAALHLEIGRMA